MNSQDSELIYIDDQEEIREMVKQQLEETQPYFEIFCRWQDGEEIHMISLLKVGEIRLIGVAKKEYLSPSLTMEKEEE